MKKQGNKSFVPKIALKKASNKSKPSNSTKSEKAPEKTLVPFGTS